MGGIFGGAPSAPTPAPPPPPPPVSTSDSAAAQDAADRERKRQLAAMGRSATILTGGFGDTSTPTTDKKVLLGA